MSVDPADASSLCHLGLMLLAEGEKAAAEAHFRESLVMDPRNARAKEALQRMGSGQPAPSIVLDIMVGRRFWSCLCVARLWRLRWLALTSGSAPHIFCKDSIARVRWIVGIAPLPPQKDGDTDDTAQGSKMCAGRGESSKTQKTKKSVQMKHEARQKKQSSSKSKANFSPAARYERATMKDGQRSESSD